MDRRRIASMLLLAAIAAIPSSRAVAAPPSPVPQDQTAPGLTLAQAVAMALRQNPAARATETGKRIAEAQLKEARAARWPLLQFTETFTRSNNPVFVFGSLLEQHSFGAQNFDVGLLNNPEALNNFRTALNLRVPLFDQWEAGTRIAQAGIGREQADQQKHLVEQQLRLEVIRTYYGVLVAEAREEVAREAVTMAEADRQRIRDLFETGVVVQSDLLAAEVQAAEFRQGRVQAGGDLVTAYAALNTALGLPVDTPQTIAGRLEEKKFELAPQEEWIRRALLHRPDYARAASAVLAAEKQVRGAWGKYLPRVDLFSTYGASGRDLLTSGGPDYAVGAGLTYNLLDLGRGARLDQARAQRVLAAAGQEKLANQIRLEVVGAYQQYVSSRERLSLAGQSVGQAAEALRIVRDRYQEGLTTITEVLRAQTAFVRTRLNLLAARYETYLGYAYLLMAGGGLTDVRPFE